MTTTSFVSTLVGGIGAATIGLTGKVNRLLLLSRAAL
jgi:hypothetical protein